MRELGTVHRRTYEKALHLETEIMEDIKTSRAGQPVPEAYKLHSYAKIETKSSTFHKQNG